MVLTNGKYRILLLLLLLLLLYRNIYNYLVPTYYLLYINITVSMTTIPKDKIKQYIYIILLDIDFRFLVMRCSMLTCERGHFIMM